MFDQTEIKDRHIMRKIAPNSESCNGVRVMSMLKSMRGFVTSRRSDMIFSEGSDPVGDALAYANRCMERDPDLAYYYIYDERGL